MINCDKCRNNLSAFIDEETTEQESSSIKEHLQKCSKCQRQYNELNGMRSALSSLRKIKTTASFDIILRDRLRREFRKRNTRTLASISSRFRAPAFTAAAVVVLLTGMLIGRTMQNPNPAINPTLAQQSDENTLQTFFNDRTVTADVRPDSSGSPVRVIYFVNADGQLQQINERQVVTVNYRLDNQRSLSRRSQIDSDQQAYGLRRGMVRQANIQTVKF